MGKIEQGKENPPDPSEHGPTQLKLQICYQLVKIFDQIIGSEGLESLGITKGSLGLTHVESFEDPRDSKREVWVWIGFDKNNQAAEIIWETLIKSMDDDKDKQDREVSNETTSPFEEFINELLTRYPLPLIDKVKREKFTLGNDSLRIIESQILYDVYGEEKENIESDKSYDLAEIAILPSRLENTYSIW